MPAPRAARAASRLSGESLIGSTLVVGGDGRYGVVEATDKIIKMAAANKVMMLLIDLRKNRQNNLTHVVQKK